MTSRSRATPTSATRRRRSSRARCASVLQGPALPDAPGRAPAPPPEAPAAAPTARGPPPSTPSTCWRRWPARRSPRRRRRPCAAGRRRPCVEAPPAPAPPPAGDRASPCRGAARAASGPHAAVPADAGHLRRAEDRATSTSPTASQRRSLFFVRGQHPPRHHRRRGRAPRAHARPLRASSSQATLEHAGAHRAARPQAAGQCCCRRTASSTAARLDEGIGLHVRDILFDRSWTAARAPSPSRRWPGTTSADVKAQIRPGPDHPRGGAPAAGARRS